MEQRRNRGGRPSKGDRITTSVRLPTSLAKEMRAEADRRELSYSEVVADALAARYGRTPLLPPENEHPTTEQMQLTA